MLFRRAMHGYKRKTPSTMPLDARVLSRKIFRGAFDMNIHNRYRKIFKVNLYEVVFAILFLPGMNITMLVNHFFHVTATAV